MTEDELRAEAEELVCELRRLLWRPGPENFDEAVRQAMASLRIVEQAATRKAHESCPDPK